MLIGLVSAAAAGAAELEADFHFNDTRSAPTGETLSDIGLGNAFAGVSVDRAPEPRQVLEFPTGNGLSLATLGLAGSGSYSVVMLVRLDSAGTGRRKLLDFADRSADAGLYLCDGTLLIELIAGSPCAGGTGVTDGDWAQVAVTRDGLTHELRAYLGPDETSAVDALDVTALGSKLAFFVDDDQFAGDEHSGGVVARIRIYDGILSANQVAALDRVDATAPAVTLDGPPAVTGDASPMFSGAAGNAAGDLAQVTTRVYAGGAPDGTPVQTITASRGGGAWSVEPSAPFGDGTYTAQAEQLDGAGNRGVSDPRTFVVDTTGTDVTLTTPASGSYTKDTTPIYSGAAGNDPGDSTTVGVNVYGGSATAGPPVQTLSASRHGTSWSVDGATPLDEGTYTAQAEQSDGVGNPAVSDPSTFVVDTTPPALALTTPASGSTTNHASPSFSGVAGADAGDLTSVLVRVYAGSLASGAPVQTLTATRDGESWNSAASTPLTDGSYAAQAEQSDAAGNTAVSAPIVFTIDTTQPGTSVVAGPSGPTNDATPEFVFSSPDAGRFLCRLYAAGDASPPGLGDCSSPRTVGPLADGDYVFEVSAVDSAGNQDDSPDVRAFRVDTVAPRTSITAGPGDSTADNAAFLFSADEPASFSCRLDSGAWEPCGSPRAHARLAMGPHRFEVRALDRAGNEEPSPAGHAWQVLKPGLAIPGVVRQAVTLARELVELRKKIRRLPLRRLTRRKSVTLTGFDALTAGTVQLRGKAVLEPRSGGRVRRVTFLLGERDIPRAGRYPINAEVTRQGRRLARRGRKLRVELRLTFTDLARRSLWATTQTTLGG